MCVQINIWVFNLIPLVTLSVFMPIQSCFHYCSSVIKLDVRDSDAFRSSFIVQDCFGSPGFFVFPYEVNYCSFKVCEECVGILMGIALNLQIAFGRTAIFTVLILLIQEHERSFHFLVSSSIFSPKHKRIYPSVNTSEY